jgi:polyisoprenoid-binding protein YceI
MKKLLLVLFAAGTLVACKENKKTSETAGEVAEATETSATYTVDSEASSVGWKGSKVVSGSHNGTISVSGGSLSVENDNLTAGNFTIDMKSIKNSDLADDAEQQAKLVGHLSSPDFFHVDSFPTATFEVTKVEAIENGENGATHNISGNLTLKGTTREITFPATVTMEEDKISATAKTEINRLEWNVMWGNENDNAARAMLKENFLSNMIELDINLVANKN